MREIKFRGLHKSGVFVYGNLILGTGLDGESICQIERTDANDFAQWSVDPKTVGQYTGLKDKYGVEIYEGDFCKGWSSEQQSIDGYFVRDLVRFHNGCAEILGRFSGSYSTMDDGKIRDVKWHLNIHGGKYYQINDVVVDGNIHQ